MTAELTFLPPIVDDDIVLRTVRVLEPREADINGVSRLTFEIPNAEYNSVLDNKNVRMRALVEFRHIRTNELLNAEETKAVPSMNLIHNLWRNIKVEMSGTVVSSQDFHYGQRAFLAKLSTATKTSQELEFSSSLFHIDEDIIGTADQTESKPGKRAGYYRVAKEHFHAEDQEKIGDADHYPVMISPETHDNLGAKLHKEFLRDRGEEEADEGQGRPHLLEDYIYETPFYNAQFFLPFGCPLKIEFDKHNNPEYYIKGENAANYKVRFLSFQLLLPYMQLASEKFAEINRLVTDQTSPLDLWITRDVIREKTVATDQNPLTFYDLFVNQVTDVLPEKLLFSFTTSKALHGDKMTNNFYYRHHNLQRWFLTLPSRQVIPDPANGQYDFAQGITEQAYKELITTLQVDSDGMGTVLSEPLFVNALSFFGARLTPKESNPKVAQATAIGSWSLCCQWHKAPVEADALILLIVGSFKSKITIHPSRAVTTNYN